MAGEELVIAQFSDIHCGDPRFDDELAEAMLTEIEELQPDVVVVVGDLTQDGYAEQFEQASDLISRVSCPRIIVTPGNHDARNVGMMHFDALFGNGSPSMQVPLRSPTGHEEGSALILAADTSKPDLNQGEFGRTRLKRAYEEICGSSAELRIVVLHHHLVSVPGTGRERNILWDAGDVLEVLTECQVDLVLCGHRHVPFVWRVNDMMIAMSGTACTRRTRGRTPPSFNIIRVLPQHIEVAMRNTGMTTGRVVSMPRRVPLAERPPVFTRRGRTMAGAAV